MYDYYDEYYDEYSIVKKHRTMHYAFKLVLQSIFESFVSVLLSIDTNLVVLHNIYLWFCFAF